MHSSSMHKIIVRKTTMYVHSTFLLEKKSYLSITCKKKMGMINFHKVFQKICGKLFPKKFVRKLFWKFPEFPKIPRRENFREIFRKIVGNFFRQTSRKETTKKSPGTFPKNRGTFRQNPLWKRVFSPQISGENRDGFLTNPGSFPENPRGNFPGNSRKFRGENSGFFSGFF